MLVGVWPGVSPCTHVGWSRTGYSGTICGFIQPVFSEDESVPRTELGSGAEELSEFWFLPLGIHRLE